MDDRAQSGNPEATGGSRQRERSRLRTAAFAVLVSAMSFTGSLVLVEFVLGRFLFPVLDQEVDKVFDAELGWVYERGTYQIKPDNAFLPYELRINELGLRATPGTVIDPPPDRSDLVVVLGDSFTFAQAIPDRETYTFRLQQLLSSGAKRPITVLNAGVEGYGTSQQLILSRRLARKGLSGKVDVLQVFPNDLLDNLRLDYSSKEVVPFRPRFTIDRHGELELSVPPARPRVGVLENDSRGRFSALRIVRTLLETRLQTHPDMLRLLARFGLEPKVPRMPGLINGWYYADVVEPGVPLMARLLIALDRESEARGAALLVILVPSPLTVYPETYNPLLKATFPEHPQVASYLREPSLPRRLILEICRTGGLSCVDLFPEFRRERARGLYFPREGHLTQAGHAIVASVLARRIKPLLMR